MNEQHFSLDWQLRRRILPALAAIDDVEHELGRVLEVYSILVDQDLCFDLRSGPVYPSNLCEDNAAFELGYTFGGKEKCGVRYSYEPTCQPGIIKNRYKLFRDRLLRAMNHVAPGYPTGVLFKSFLHAVPRHDIQFSNTTVTIAAVHHYADRLPRLKAYFSCDYDDPKHARQKACDLVATLEDPELDSQIHQFFRFYRPQGGVRMVGLDFEPDKPGAAKVYKTGYNLSKPGLGRLIAYAGGAGDAVSGVAAFQEIFLDGRREPSEFDLVTLALRRGGQPGLKLYIRPVDFYSDGEALKRLRRWYAYLGRTEELAQVERGLAVVTPLDVLENTKGFFNYISVDVGVEGVSKTSLYYTPQIPLMYLARHDADRLKRL